MKFGIHFRKISIDDKRHEVGFTLIELLVVIAIIAILAALLLPVLENARKQGLKAATTNNMKQMGVAINLYVEDNNGSLPGPFTIAVFDYGNSQPQPTDVPHFGMYIATYLGAGKVTSVMKVLQNPSLSSAALENSNVANYVTEWNLPAPPDPDAYRFGSWSVPDYTMAEAAIQPNQPKKMLGLDIRGLRMTFMCTADQQDWNSSDNVTLPETAPFDGKRLWLALDSSVVLSANTNPFAQ